MRSFLLGTLVALAATSEVVLASGSGSSSGSHEANGLKHARMLRRRGLNGAASPCKRNSTGIAGSNVKVNDASGNLSAYISGVDSSSDVTTRSKITVIDGSDTRVALDMSSSTSTRQSLQVVDSSSSSSSDDWSSSASAAAPSTSAAVSVNAGYGASNSGSGSTSGSGMSTVQSWSGNDFQSWDFFTHADPTHGNVDYVSLADAQADNLLGLVDGQFKISVSTGALVGNNRKSVRISSPQKWKKGQLVLADIAHMPVGCGTWPAFWSIGMDRAWPAGGEIDILEGVNSVNGNTYSAHTETGCTLSGQSTSASSSLSVTQDCQYQPGCSYKDRVDNSFGPAFNSAGGGVFASYFDDAGIKIWFFTASAIPDSIKNGSPDMSEFGTPKAFFGSDQCDMDSFFDPEQMLIINTTIMGDWAGSTFWQNGCSGTLAGTLADASNFNDAYWLINSVKIFA